MKKKSFLGELSRLFKVASLGLLGVLSLGSVALAQDYADIEARLADLEAASKKKSFVTTKLNGRIFLDGATYGQDANSINNVDPIDNGVEFRTLRLSVRGDIGDSMFYRTQLDFVGKNSGHDHEDSVGGDTSTDDGVMGLQLKDVYIGYRLPHSKIQVGHFKECWGLEDLTSSRFTTFLERSPIYGLGNVGGRKLGIAYRRTLCNEMMTFGLGTYRSQSNDNMYLDTYEDMEGYSFSTRLTRLLWYKKVRRGGCGTSCEFDECDPCGGSYRRQPIENYYLFHLGFNYTYRDYEDGSRIRFRARPDAHMAPRPIDWSLTRNSLGASMNAVRFEMLWIHGPLSFQSEWAGMWSQNNSGAEEAYVNAIYGQVGYFLTGESLAYKRSSATINRVKVGRPVEFKKLRGIGAWQLAYRFDYTQFEDSTLSQMEGRMANHTLGVNWFVNDYSRLMFNYVSSTALEQGQDEGKIDAFLVRAQVDF